MDTRTRRPDLEALPIAQRPGYLTGILFPMLPRAMMQGTLYYHDILSDVARGVWARSKQRLDGIVTKRPLVDELEVIDQHAFLVDVRAERRHRSGRDSANVGVVRA